MCMVGCLNYYNPSPLTYWFTVQTPQTRGLTTVAALTTTGTQNTCLWSKTIPYR